VFILPKSGCSLLDHNLPKSTPDRKASKSWTFYFLYYISIKNRTKPLVSARFYLSPQNLEKRNAWSVIFANALEQRGLRLQLDVPTLNPFRDLSVHSSERTHQSWTTRVAKTM
jgi:hypothetical protein